MKTRVTLKYFVNNCRHIQKSNARQKCFFNFEVKHYSFNISSIITKGIRFHVFCVANIISLARLLILQLLILHSVHQGINSPPPPLKNTTPLFLAKPPLNLQTVQAPPPPPSRQSPQYIGFS